MRAYCIFNYEFERKCLSISRHLIIFLVSSRFQMTFRNILKNIPWCKLREKIMPWAIRHSMRLFVSQWYTLRVCSRRQKSRCIFQTFPGWKLPYSCGYICAAVLENIPLWGPSKQVFTLSVAPFFLFFLLNS
jgi:hypothetical protein